MLNDTEGDEFIMQCEYQDEPQPGSSTADDSQPGPSTSGVYSCNKVIPDRKY